MTTHPFSIQLSSTFSKLLLSSAAALLVGVACTPSALAQDGQDHGVPTTPESAEAVIDEGIHAIDGAVEETLHAQPDSDTHADPVHADDAHAGDTHAAASPIQNPKEAIATAITALIVFLVVLGVLAKMVAPKILGGLADRESKFRDEIQAAEKARIQAKEALVEYEKSLAEARAEAKQMLEETRSQQTQLAADLKSKADADLTSMKDRARREIDSARRAAVADIYNEASTLATNIAGKILQRELSASDHQRLVDESLAELQSISRSN